jgi:predicted hotdog family 3-hydroxylacyl-ACP dehydratase
MEQYLIVRAITEPNDALKERLRWLLKGAVHPHRKDETQPYDVQFELFAGAALTHAGIQGVRLDEPDWRIVAGDREVGIAAKRVSSNRNYTKLVRKAISQIRRQGCPGVIVLNLDAVVGTLEPSEAAAQVTAMVKEARQLVATLKAEDIVFCLFGFATSFQLLWSSDGGALGIDVFTHGEVIEPDLSGAAKIRAWFQRIGDNIMRSASTAMQEMPG